MYAQLCKRLSDSVSQFDSGKPVAIGTTLGTGGGPQTFLDVLSKVCWEKFENRFKYYLVTGEDPVNGQEAVLSADDEERHHVVKQKMLGNLKFIGELYLLGQLDDPIIHNCILQLLGNDKVSADIQVRCQDLECLCQLIRTCGKSLDAGPGGNLMDQYFHKMTKDSQKHQVYPPRIRFMLRDVIDLRADQWMPRTALSQQPGPMPIHLLRGSTKEDDDREAASTEHHHRMLSRGGDRDPFGSGSPNRGGRDDRGNLYGGRGSGGRDPMRGGDSLMSSTDLFMSKIPGFNDMFNNLSLGTSSTSSLLPPPPLMHNNRFLRDNKDGGERDYRGGGGGGGAGREGGYDRRAGGGEQRNNRDDYYHNNNSGGAKGGGGYRQNNNNNNNGGGENRGNYGGRDNQYGGRGSGGNYRDQQQSQNNTSSSDRHNNNNGSGNSSYQRRGDAAEENDQQQTRGGRDSQDNNGYTGRNSREGGRDQHRDREGGQRSDGGEGRNNYYNNRSNSPYNNNNNGGRENGHTGNNSNGGGNRDYNRGGDRDGGGYMNGGGFNNGQQSNYHRNRNNNTNQQGGNYNQNAGTGGNYQNNRYNNNISGSNNNKGGPLNGGTGAAGIMNGGQQKDLAPRFKRTMMGAGGPGGVGGQRDNNYHGSNGAGMPERGGQSGINNAMSSSTSSSASSGAGGGAAGQGEGGAAAAGVENVQMRPAANSLLFKANTMNVNKLPLSQPQQRVIPTNSMLANQQQQGQGQQEKEKGQQDGRDNSASPFRNSPIVGKKDGGGGGLIILGRGGVMAADQQKLPEVSKDKEQQQQDSPVDAKAGNKKKKDKGPSKEEVLKKFTEFLDESYFVRLVKEEATVEEGQLDTKVEQDGKKIDESPEGAEGVAADSELKTEDKEVVAEEPKNVAVPVEREQTLEEIVKQYVDLKVPDKFVKDCLATLCSVSMEREMKENAETVPSLTDLLMAENATSAAVTGWWSLSAVERSVVFVDELKKHQKLGNNVAEAVKQLVQSVSTETPKQLPWMSKWLAVAALREVYGLGELGALTDNGKYYPLMLDTLQRLNVGDAAAKKRLTEVFLAAKVDLLQVLPEGERNKEQLVAVLDERGLDFLCPLLKVQSQMWKQIQTDANPQLFYKWIKENVDAAFFVEEGFIQALVTVLLKQITQETTLPEGADLTKNPDKALIEKEKQALQKYSAVLNAFLNSAKLQLIAIYALQVYCHSVDFPKGMLLRWFTALYDLNVVEEEAFLQWKEDLSEAFPGKQRALFQVNAWLMWLQEAESEEEEEDN